MMFFFAVGAVCGLLLAGFIVGDIKGGPVAAGFVVLAVSAVPMPGAAYLWVKGGGRDRFLRSAYARHYRRRYPALRQDPDTLTPVQTAPQSGPQRQDLKVFLAAGVGVLPLMAIGLLLQRDALTVAALVVAVLAGGYLIGIRLWARRVGVVGRSSRSTSPE